LRSFRDIHIAAFAHTKSGIFVKASSRSWRYVVYPNITFDIARGSRFGGLLIFLAVRGEIAFERKEAKSIEDIA